MNDSRSRSNYFAVKDAAAFVAFCKQWDLTPITQTANNGETLHGFTRDDSLPTFEYYDDATESIIDADFDGAFAAHLADGHVAIFQEVGYDKMRYFSGYARAINNKGDVVELSIADIVSLAEPLGEHITDCAY